MTCPRCNYEWDVSKTPCPNCGLKVNLPFRTSPRSATPSERSVPQTPRPAPPLRPGTPLPSERQQGNNAPKQVSGLTQFPITQSERNATSSFPRGVRRPQENRLPSTQMYNAPNTPFPMSAPSTEQPQASESHNFSQPSLPILPEPGQSFELPSAASPLADAPRVIPPALPADFASNPLLSRMRPSESFPQNVPTTERNLADSENIFARNVPHRPQVQPIPSRSTENLLESQRTIRPSRLVTDALMKEEQPLRPGMPDVFAAASNHVSAKNDVAETLLPLTPGTLLRGGRYRLRESQERQNWREGVYEATWIAQDAQRASTPVMIRELVTPESKSMGIQSTLRSATMALTSVGRNSHIPTLWDAFSDQGRSFFVFEPIGGESLLGYMRRTGRALPEQDVIEFCLQMTEVLELLTQQTPSLVHGLIRPEHVIIKRMSADYILTNFSIVLAGGATQYVTNTDRSSLSPYMAPEFAHGIIDGRSDLYALMATAYHAATGSIPTQIDGTIPQPQRFNPTISSEFDAILTRGLRPNPAQRYQRPSELRQDLLAMHSVNGTLASRSGTLAVPDQTTPERPVNVQPVRSIQASIPNDTSASQVLPSLLDISGFGDQEQKMLLPQPEELPAMPERNDAQLAAIWLIGILICLIVIVIISRGII